MAGQGMDPEQLRRLNKIVEQMAEPFRRMGEECERLVGEWQQMAKLIEDETTHEIDQEVQGFGSMLDNMTDAQILRELRSSGEETDGE